MTNSERHANTEEELRAEVIRLNKMVQALMNRAERSTSLHSSDFNQFQATVMLEELVRQRTHELEAALRENEKITRALREAEQKFHRVLEQSMVGITMLVDNRFHYANPKFAEIIGYRSDEILQLNPMDITPKNEQAFAKKVIARCLEGEFAQVTFSTHVVRKDGQLIDVEIAGGAPIDINGKPALISVWQDITERVRNEREISLLQDRLREQAIRDPLTGLYNRLFLTESLDRELAQATRQEHPVSVVMTDLDHFKTVNDRYGHLAGDEVLRQFAAIMKNHSRDSDINCRYGGEEFFLVLPRTNLETACERAEQLRLAIAKVAVIFNNQDIPVTASFGVAAFPLDGTSSVELMAAADNALYAAKERGRNRVVSSSTLNTVTDCLSLCPHHAPPRKH